MSQPIIILLGQLRKALAKLETIPASDDYNRCAVFINEGPEAASQMCTGSFTGDVMLMEVVKRSPPASRLLTTHSSRTADKPLLLFSDVPPHMRGVDEEPPTLGKLAVRCMASTAGRLILDAPAADRLALLTDELSLSDFGNVRFHQCRAAVFTEAKTAAPTSRYLCTTHRKVLQARGQHSWREEILYLRKKYNLPDTAGSELL